MLPDIKLGWEIAADISYFKSIKLWNITSSLARVKIKRQVPEVPNSCI